MLEGTSAAAGARREKLVGIISDRDIFRRSSTSPACATPGTASASRWPIARARSAKLPDRVRSHGFSLLGILSSYEKVPKGSRRVVIRTGVAGDFEAMRADLEKAHPGVDIRKG